MGQLKVVHSNGDGSQCLEHQVERPQPDEAGTEPGHAQRGESDSPAHQHLIHHRLGNGDQAERDRAEHPHADPRPQLPEQILSPDPVVEERDKEPSSFMFTAHHYEPPITRLVIPYKLGNFNSCMLK